jgi:hypothetical protein
MVRKRLDEKGLMPRDLASATDYSYEHVRKVLKGETNIGEDFHERLCRALDLDPVEMGQLLVSEKVSSKYGAAFKKVLAPPDTELRRIWPDLTDVQKKQITAIALGFKAQNDALAGSTPPVPQQVNVR